MAFYWVGNSELDNDENSLPTPLKLPLSTPSWDKEQLSLSLYY